MSDVYYVRCDGCGNIMPDAREDSWHRMNVASWAEVQRYDENEGRIMTYDYCSDCFEKMLKVVG